MSNQKIKFYDLHNFDKIKQLQYLSKNEILELKVVAHILPFRVNNYVLDELIDWSNIPSDPIYQLTFLKKQMLKPEHFEQMQNALTNNYKKEDIRTTANCIRMQMNPHPSGQMTTNVPLLDNNQFVSGVQHKYRETCLVFPSNGQTCHTYCAFCFRWPQFTNIKGLRFSTDQSKTFLKYIKQHKEITNVLFTGGDPLVMPARKLSEYIEPLLTPEFEHIQTIRIGTKSLSYWPYRFVTDVDSNDILSLFEKVVSKGKQLSIVAHYNHYREMSTDIAKLAIQNVRKTGALIRTQSPILRYVNDDPDVWVKLWNMQERLSCIPYYMFIERNTGSSRYFSVPLDRALKIFQSAFKHVSGFSRKVCGPTMSTFSGKVIVQEVKEINGEKVFSLKYVQARDPDLCNREFFAKYDSTAKWFTDLKPFKEEDEIFFQDVKSDTPTTSELTSFSSAV